MEFLSVFDAKRLAIATALCAATAAAFAATPTNFVQHNLVADTDGVADKTDPHLQGAWGMSTSPTSPFWVSNVVGGTATVYTSDGTPNATLVVTIPPSPNGQAKQGTPTGQVWNGAGPGTFAVNGTASSFIFCTIDGTIAAWNGGAGTTAVTMVDNNGSAAYLGLGIGTSSAGPTLYAANFLTGNIDTFDQNFQPITVDGAFWDPDRDSDLKATNIQRFGRRLYVTYGYSDGRGGFATGPSTGLIEVFDGNGNLLQRLVPENDNLNVPWGMAVTGANFGPFSYALIVANFGDGTIAAFDLNSGNYLGKMQDGQGNNIVVEGIWGLLWGNGGNGGAANALYFAAATGGGAHGLLGSLVPAADSRTP